MSKTKKGIRNKIRSELKNLNTEFNIDKHIYKKPKNRYELKKEKHLQEKRLRNERKLAKFHIAKRRDLRKRWEMELEYFSD
ncbi:MAG: hypothetical protein ACTSRZ_17195 [Promethearchaeota archaeon]